MLLVDGNNVMGQRVGWHKNKPLARRTLLNEIADYARAKSLSVTVVFDGAADEHFPDGASYRGVRVCYARQKSNADERIKEIVEAERQKQTLTVVTSDRALADYVRRCGVKITRAGELRRTLDAFTRNEQPALEKPRAGVLSEDELLKEMRYFGVAPEDDE